MSKYDLLKHYLRGKNDSQREISLGLDQVETIIGAPLPKSAYKYREWWSNQANILNRPQAKAWTEAGYKVESIRGQSAITAVRFVRQ